MLALSRAPLPVDGSRDLLRGPIFIAPDPDSVRKAYVAWRAQVILKRSRLWRVVTATDPSLAPLGAATMTVTAGCVPHRRLDGAWCFWKRDELRIKVLAQLEQIFPGITQTLVGWEVLAPVDIEEQLGVTDGDLIGGELAGDQMFGSRPWPGQGAFGVQTGVQARAHGRRRTQARCALAKRRQAFA